MRSGALANKNQLGSLNDLEDLTKPIQDACRIHGSLPSISIVIRTDKLSDEGIPVIKALFSYLLQDTHSIELTIYLQNDASAFPLKIKINIESISFDDHTVNVFDDYHILSNSTLSIGLLEALQENNLPIDVGNWCRKLSAKLSSPLPILPHLIKNLIKIFVHLYNISKDPLVIDVAFPVLVSASISARTLNTFPELHDEPFSSALKKSDRTFLHEAMAAGDPEGFELILKLLGGKPQQNYDEQGNSFLHLCNNEKLLQKALAFTPDINHRNNDGNTALHRSAFAGNLAKAHFLLRNGADTNIVNKKNHTFWMVTSHQSNSLELFRIFKVFGQVLRLPPEMAMQAGPTCGFYAAACAANFHHAWKPNLFQQPPLPARKRDTHPKSPASLRQKRKELGIPGQGSIFSAQQLAAVIEKTECKSLICEINDFRQFMNVIEKALEQNLPVIIPFACTPTASPTAGKLNLDLFPLGRSAHWATIIGFSNDGSILIAHWGNYFEVDASKLFNAFYEIEPTHPERFLAKKKGLDWEFSETKIEATADIETATIPITDLTDFRRKLIIVLPPQYDLNLLNFKQTNHTNKY